MTKPSALAGWSLFLLLLLCTIYSCIANLGAATSSSLITYAVHGLFNAFIFGFSTWLLNRFEPYRQHIRMRNIRINRLHSGFVVSVSAVAAILCFLIYDLTVYTLTGTFRGIFDLYPMAGSLSASRLLPALVLLALLPAVTEELLLRGVFFSLYESEGTATALLLTAGATAMLAPNIRLVLPTLIAGLFCGYVSYLTGSVRSAALCRFIIRAYLVLMTYAANRIGSESSWTHFVALQVVLLFIAIYFALRTLSNLVREELVPQFQPAPDSLRQRLSDTALNTGFLLFVMLFLARMVVSLLMVILV